MIEISYSDIEKFILLYIKESQFLHQRSINMKKNKKKVFIQSIERQVVKSRLVLKSKLDLKPRDRIVLKPKLELKPRVKLVLKANSLYS